MESKGRPDQRKRANGGGWPPARYRSNGTKSHGTTPVLATLPAVARSFGEARRGRRSDYLRNELRKPGIYLFPLRLLVAVAWLWSYATRIVEPGWRDGSILTAFFARQLDEGLVVFPEYRTLIAEVLVPYAAIVGWGLLIGQLAVGISLLFGAATNAALLVGIAINLNLLLAGSLEPSVLAIVVQALLLLANAGAVFGIDEWFGRVVRASRLAGPRERTPARHMGGCIWRAAGLVAALAVAVYGGVYAAVWNPPGLFHDPAAMLAVLAGLVAAWLTIGCLRVATGVTTIENDALVSDTPGWSAGWEPLSGIAGDSAAIDHLGTADLEWSFRDPLPEWSVGTGRRQG